eukprot:GHRQ01021409.1.p1 GENE.GHRQ01021409.1~~GHRQ01021409.1.p1  ORF type:complete len:174 (-),score=31.83 GHRQ01021409.1:588-1109(-)
MAPEPAKPKRRWPWQKEEVVVPLFDDVNCPYGVKPSDLFKVNEVRLFGSAGPVMSLPHHAKQLSACCLLPSSALQEKDMSKLKELGGVAGLCAVLKTDQQHGLDPAGSGDVSIEEHRRVYGANTFPPVPQKNFFALCWENVQDPIILLLIAAALVRRSFNMLVEASTRTQQQC